MNSSTSTNISTSSRKQQHQHQHRQQHHQQLQASACTAPPVNSTMTLCNCQLLLGWRPQLTLCAGSCNTTVDNVGCWGAVARSCSPAQCVALMGAGTDVSRVAANLVARVGVTHQLLAAGCARQGRISLALATHGAGRISWGSSINSSSTVSSDACTCEIIGSGWPLL
jgi:hypothetical protein